MADRGSGTLVEEEAVEEVIVVKEEAEEGRGL